VRTDVTELAQVQALAARAFETFGAVHVLCNNAGVAAWAASRRDTPRLAVGARRQPLGRHPRRGGVRAAHDRARRAAHIVNTASMAGLIASKGLGVYNTSKYAVVGLSETLVKDLKPYRIGVSVLCPLGVETRIRDSERTGPPRSATSARTGRSRWS